MTTKAEIMTGMCDAVFLGDNPLESVAPLGSLRKSKMLYAGGEQRITVVDYGEGSLGGAVRITSDPKNVRAIYFEGDGLRTLNTILGETLTTTIAEIARGGEVAMRLTPEQSLHEPAIVKVKHTIDKI